MTCTECMEFLAAHGTIRGPFPADVRRHLDGCLRCAARLEALRLVEDGPALRVRRVPGLAQSIAAKAAEAELPRRGKRSAARWVPVAAAAAVLLALSVAFAARFGAARGTGADVVRVHLTLSAPAAREVDVVGDWNGWKPGAQPMRRQDGQWNIDLELQRGRCYQYQFLIDGDTWIPDPRGLARVSNGFGGVNSLLGS